MEFCIGIFLEVTFMCCSITNEGCICVFICMCIAGEADPSVLAKCNPCLSNPCMNHGTCQTDSPDLYKCTCVEGFKVRGTDNMVIVLHCVTRKIHYSFYIKSVWLNLSTVH